MSAIVRYGSAAKSGHGKATPSTPSSQNSIASHYDTAALRFARPGLPAFELAAQRERELGYRYPAPYAAAAEEQRRVVNLALGTPRPSSLDAPGGYIGPDGSIFPARSIAGERLTFHGTGGRDQLNDFRARPWDARDQLGAAALGGRGPGFIPGWDNQERARRSSGKLIGVQGMNQTVHHDRPYLSLRATASMSVRVTAGMAGGFDQSRDFFLGGGYTASFMLADYDSVHVETLTVETATTELQFAWLTTGMQAGDQTLYIPMRVTVAFLGIFTVVPQGAYLLYCEQNDPNWSWDVPVIAGYTVAAGGGFPGVNAGVPGLASAQSNQVMGTRFNPSLVNDIMWALRPI